VLLIYLAVYVFILLIVWGFYAVARMHTLKFKRFSTHIVPVTNFLLIFLIILSILGFILIFFISPSGSTKSMLTPNDSETTENVEVDSWDDYREEIIWNEHY